MDFVQIGSNIGNSPEDIIWSLVKEKGWRGLLIEPLPTEFKVLCECYVEKNCLFENCAVMDYDGYVDLNINTNNYRNHKDKHNMQASVLQGKWKNYNNSVVKVPCKTLTTIFSEYNLTKTPIEMLQIDAEGMDIKILNCTDFTDMCIRYIRFEKVHFTNIEVNETTNHLSKFGYEQILDVYDDGSSRDIMLEKKEKKI